MKRLTVTEFEVFFVTEGAGGDQTKSVSMQSMQESFSCPWDFEPAVGPDGQLIDCAEIELKVCARERVPAASRHWGD